MNIIKLHQWLLIGPLFALSYTILYPLIILIFNNSINAHSIIAQFFWHIFLLLPPLALPLSGFIGTITGALIIHQGRYPQSLLTKLAFFIHPLSLIVGLLSVLVFYWVTTYTF